MVEELLQIVHDGVGEVLSMLPLSENGILQSPHVFNENVIPSDHDLLLFLLLLFEETTLVLLLAGTMSGGRLCGLLDLQVNSDILQAASPSIAS